VASVNGSKPVLGPTPPTDDDDSVRDRVALLSAVATAAAAAAATLTDVGASEARNSERAACATGTNSLSGDG
jgi:hypothetical protein